LPKLKKQDTVEKSKIFQRVTQHLLLFMIFEELFRGIKWYNWIYHN